MGLEGKESQSFVSEQLFIERDERQRKREFKRAKMEAEEALREHEYERKRDEKLRKHEYELKKLELEACGVAARVTGAYDARSKTSKLPSFSDGHDKLDSYLQRFERFAKSCECKEDEWATYLSASLTGKALNTYSRLSDADAGSNARLKSALLKRYNLTEECYKTKFRRVRPEQNETPLQFVVRLRCYLGKWMTLSDTDKAAPEAIQDLFVKEQFLNSCPHDLSAHLREKPLRTMDEVADAAEKFLTARNRQLYMHSNSHNRTPPRHLARRNLQLRK